MQQPLVDSKQNAPKAGIPFCLPIQNQEEGVIKAIYAYQKSTCKFLAYILLNLLTCGIWWLLLRWNLAWKIKLLYSPTTHLHKATHVKVEGDQCIELLHLKDMHFTYRFQQYAFHEGQFVPIETPFQQMTNKQIWQTYIHSKPSDVIDYGPNSTTIPEKGVFTILIDEILSPFYIFQLFSVSLWSLEGYIYYASVILLTSLISVIFTLYETRKNYQKLRDMSSQMSEELRYENIQDANPQAINSVEIRPGDLIEVKDNWVVPCDCILVEGSCIVNESMLTGEALPILKTGLPNTNSKYCPNEDSKQNTLFAGTKCIDSRDSKLAMASQTGFATMKGQLVKSILYPKPTKFSFHRDAMYFIGVLAIMALIGNLVTLREQIRQVQMGEYAAWYMAVNMLDLTTITVPPALPTCLSIGISFALRRMQKKEIYCISPNRVNVGGKITIMCFDKTGTLTEEGLDMHGVREAAKEQFCKLQEESEQMSEIMGACHTLTRVHGEIVGDPLEMKMFEASKWSLVEKGKEVKVTKGERSIQILKRFEFSSSLQRMSVIVRENETLTAYVKGSPEKIRELCVSVPANYHAVLESYVRNGYRVLGCAKRSIEAVENERGDIEHSLQFIGLLIMQNKLKPITTSIIDKLYEANIRTIMVTGDNILTAISVARQCRIVRPDQSIYLGDLNDDGAIDWKDFDQNSNQLDRNSLLPSHLQRSQEVEQHQVQEKSALQCSHKKSFKEIADEINHENYDDIVDVVDDFEVPWEHDANFTIAVTGKLFMHLYHHHRRTFGLMLERASVFARMKPDEKALLIQTLQQISRKALCGMCGDGANDCGALKTADIGVSLSEAEASIAAPFTSRIQDISCIVKILREGRASLVTSFSCFKFMALYSMIQFTTVTLLYFVGSNLGDWQFLYIDLFIIIPLAATMGLTKSYKTLVPFQPGSNLISFPVLFSVIGQTVIQIGFQSLVYLVLTQRSWYIDAYHLENDQLSKCYENSSLFLYANFQYVGQCLVLSIGKPFRRSFYTNKSFTILLVVIVIFNGYIMFLYQYPSGVPEKIFELMDLNYNWRLLLVGILLGNMMVMFVFEKYIVIYTTRAYRSKKRQILKRYRMPENPYLQ